MVNSCEELIRSQLKDVIGEGDFDVGFVHGTKVVCIQNRLEIQEFWKTFRTSNLILCCDGLKGEPHDVTHSGSANKKKILQSNSEDVQKTVDNLKERTSITTSCR